MTITAKLAEALQAVLKSQRLGYDVVMRAKSVLAEYEAATLRQQGGRVDEITDEDRPATRTAAMTYTAKGVREAAAGLTYTLDGDGVYSAMLRSFADMLEAQEGGTDALDAKRYRWLRDAGPDNIEVYFATTSNPSGWGDWDGWTDKDAAIDAAMAEGGEG